MVEHVLDEDTALKGDALVEAALKRFVPRFAFLHGHCSFAYLREGVQQQQAGWVQVLCELVSYGQPQLRAVVASDEDILAGFGAYMLAPETEQRRWERCRRALLLLLAPCDAAGTLKSQGMLDALLAYMQRGQQLLLPLFEQLPGGCSLLLDTPQLFTGLQQAVAKASTYCVAPLVTLITSSTDAISRHQGFLQLLSRLVESGDAASVVLMEELSSDAAVSLQLLQRQPQLLAAMTAGTTTCLSMDRGVGHLHALVTLAVTPAAAPTLLSMPEFKSAIAQMLAVGLTQPGLAQTRSWQQVVRLLRTADGRQLMLVDPTLRAPLLQGLQHSHHQSLAATATGLLLQSPDSRSAALGCPQLMQAVMHCLGALAAAGSTHDWDGVIEALVASEQGQQLLLSHQDAVAALAAGIAMYSSRSIAAWDALASSPAALQYMLAGISTPRTAASSSSSSSSCCNRATTISSSSSSVWVKATAVILERGGLWQGRLINSSSFLQTVVDSLHAVLTASPSDTSSTSNGSTDATPAAATPGATVTGPVPTTTAGTTPRRPRWSSSSGGADGSSALAAWVEYYARSPRATEGHPFAQDEAPPAPAGIPRLQSTSSTTSSSSGGLAVAAAWRDLLQALARQEVWRLALLNSSPFMEVFMAGISAGHAVFTDTLACWLAAPDGAQQLLQPPHQQQLVAALQQGLSLGQGSGACAAASCQLLLLEPGRGLLGAQEALVAAMGSSLEADAVGEWRAPLKGVMQDPMAVAFMLGQEQLSGALLKTCLHPGWSRTLLSLLSHHRPLRHRLLQTPQLFDGFLKAWGGATGEDLAVLQEVWGFIKMPAVPLLLARLADKQLVRQAWRALQYISSRSSTAAALVTQELQRRAEAADRVLLLEQQMLGLRQAAVELAGEHSRLVAARAAVHQEREALAAEVQHVAAAHGNEV